MSKPEGPDHSRKILSLFPAGSLSSLPSPRPNLPLLFFSGKGRLPYLLYLICQLPSPKTSQNVDSCLPTAFLFHSFSLSLFKLLPLLIGSRIRNQGYRYR